MTTFMKQVVYLVVVIICITIYTMQKTMVQIPSLVNNYLNDLLSMILVLKICEICIRKTFKVNIVDQLKYLIFIWLYFSFLFEYVLPQIHERYTADIYDILAYFLGLIIFILIERNDFKKMFGMWKVYR